MSEFKPGEIVDITIKGARVHRVASEGHDADVTPILDLTIVEADGRHFYAQVPADWPSVTVERVAPAEWPPRPGDLWRDKDGDLWFAVTREKFISPSGSRYGTDVESVSSQFAPLTLIYRDGGEGR